MTWLKTWSFIYWVGNVKTAYSFLDSTVSVLIYSISGYMNLKALPKQFTCTWIKMFMVTMREALCERGPSKWPTQDIFYFIRYRNTNLLLPSCLAEKKQSDKCSSWRTQWNIFCSWVVWEQKQSLEETECAPCIQKHNPKWILIEYSVSVNRQPHAS